MFEGSLCLLLSDTLVRVSFGSVHWGRSVSVTFRTYGFVIPTNLIHRIPVYVVVALGYLNVFLREWLGGLVKILIPILTLELRVRVQLCFFLGIVGHRGETGVLVGKVSLGLKTL